jgi:hypothetical protein
MNGQHNESQISEATWPIQTSIDLIQFPGMNFDITVPEPQMEYPMTETHPLSEEGFDEQVWMGTFQLPPKDSLAELIELFFDNLYHVFPCFHRKSFQAQVQDSTMQRDSSLVLYAMCCVSARYHPHLSIKKCTKDWYEQAKFAYQITPRDPWPGLRTLQAALLLTYHASTVGDFSSSWLFLGKAWRQAIALGLHKLDASEAALRSLVPQDINTGHGKLSGLGNRRDTNAVEKEEYRRTLWLLLIMDRNHAWPTGWPNAISETHFKVDIPIVDSRFQIMDPEMKESVDEHVPFTRNLDRLITDSYSTTRPVNVFHYICIAYIILGRVSELIHSLHDEPDTSQYAEACEELDSHIVKFKMSLPRQATSILETAPEDRGYIVWLQITLNTSAILLHYRSVKDISTADVSPHFTLAVTAARNTAQVLKDASRISIDLLLSAHIGSSLYVAACVLIIQWRATGDPRLKEELDLFELVFDRMDEVFLFLGLKYKLALAHDLQSSTERMEELKTRGARGLLADCGKWTHVKNEMQRRGMTLEIT